MKAYFDSSVFLRLILGEPGRLAKWEHYDPIVCSELVEVECLRTLDRLRLAGHLSEEEVVRRRGAVFEVLDAVEIIEITRPVLKRAAESFPLVLGTLDAIHLSSALAWREERGADLVMATHDKTLSQAARAFGIKTVGI